MHSILRFIQRNGNFLVFVLLEVVAFLLILFNNDYPKSSTLSTANSLVAKQYEWISGINEYFSLKTSNESLQAENARLQNELVRLRNIEESYHEYNDEYVYADLTQYYIPGKVIHISSQESTNYLTLNKGERDGVKPGMGVCNEDGVLGIICTVSHYYSIAIPIIHKDAKISCRIKKNDYIGTVEWNGENKKYAQLKEVAIHVDIQKGDTIISSGLSSAFPPGIPLGVIESFEKKDGNFYYDIELRLLADFQRVKNVYIIGDMMAEEKEKIIHEQH